MPKPVSLPFRPRNPMPPNSAFGWRPLYGDNHTGIDFNSTTGVVLGKDIPAAGGGIVLESYNGNEPGRSNWAKLRGTMVMIDHGNGWRTRYHMLIPNSNIKVGSIVKAGQTIGKVGSSGSSTTGPHLHFELWINGVAVDPLKYLSYNPQALATETHKPFDNKQKEDEDMIVVKNTATNEHFAVGTEYIHFLAPVDATLVSKVVSTLDEIHLLGAHEFGITLEAHGVPGAYGSAKALKAYGAGDKWSRGIENGRKGDDLWHKVLAILDKPGVDSEALAKVVAAAIVGSVEVIEPKVDVEAIADAVVAKLPGTAATKEDVVEAITSVTFRAE